MSWSFHISLIEIYINYILLKVVAALQMKSVILLAPATTSRLATPVAIKDGLLRVGSIIYAIRCQTGNRSFVSQNGLPGGYTMCRRRCRWSGSKGVVAFSYRGLLLSRGGVFGGGCGVVCGASRLPFCWFWFVFVLLLPSHVSFQGVVCISPCFAGSFVGISGITGFVWFGMC